MIGGMWFEPAFLRACYFLSAAAVFFSIVLAVVLLGWHSWDRMFFWIPIGLILGWMELIAFPVFGTYSVKLAFGEMGKWRHSRGSVVAYEGRRWPRGWEDEELFH